MSEVTIKGVTWCRVDGGWWCTSASRLANGYDAERRRITTALDEVVRLREENARLRAVIEEAAAFLVADLCPTGGANTADVMAVVARLRTAVEAQS